MNGQPILKLNLKKLPFGQKPRKPLKRTKIRVVGHSTTADDKKEIQRLVRLIVTMRDGGCILRTVRGCGATAEVEDEKVISETTIQADHLVTRANSATYADTRLIVCLCQACHGGFKKWHEKEYEALVRRILPPERVRLWDKAEELRQAHVTCKVDWKLAIIVLRQELRTLQANQ